RPQPRADRLQDRALPRAQRRRVRLSRGQAPAALARLDLVDVEAAHLVEREHLLAVAHAGRGGNQDEVEAGPAVDVVMTVSNRDHPVAPGPGLESIVAGTVDERVGPVAADQRVVAL